MEKNCDFTIKMISNGFIVGMESVNLEGLWLEYGFTDEDDTVALVKLFEFLAERLGHPYDKYAKNNISITTDKIGHRFRELEQEKTEQF